MRDIWNPWHGCKKYSEGCANCYMYALDARRGVQRPSDEIYKTGGFDFPIKKDRHKNYKVRPGERIRVNMTSDTFLPEAAQWLPDMWAIIRKRPDVIFWLLTKRVPYIMQGLPPDWGQGYPNVMLNMTAENQRAFDERWPIFEQIPAVQKGICCAPMLGAVDLSPALDSGQVCEVSAGGENYDNPRPCEYAWYESLSRQCEQRKVNFHWYETGTRILMPTGMCYIPYKHDQAMLAGMSGLNRFYGRPGFILTDPADGHVLADSELWTPMYDPQHCLGCGNRNMCNGCDPACPNRDKSYRQVTAQELAQLEAAWAAQNGTQGART